RALIEEEVRQSALGIARATARSRTNGDFKAELETARGALHAAAAALDQAIRRGDAAQDELRTLIVDSSRMLGALIRSVSSSSAQTARAEAEEVAV
ncbi:MAG TPA: hypothetical protein VM737_05880, partial [Gemmatimonadota bacterium]|nr:hypothetical protein [Gemmatimonadota bacterium]